MRCVIVVIIAVVVVLVSDFHPILSSISLLVPGSVCQVKVDGERRKGHLRVGREVRGDAGVCCKA